MLKIGYKLYLRYIRVLISIFGYSKSNFSNTSGIVFYQPRNLEYFCRVISGISDTTIPLVRSLLVEGIGGLSLVLSL